MRFPPAFDEKEGSILGAMYEVQNGTYDSYSLAQKVKTTAQVGTSAAALGFTETRDATERLIARGLVRGKRQTGADGVYFTKLRLTPKGEQAAIRQRRQAEETRKAIAEAERRSAEVIKEMRDRK
jgi:hypothetical protein